MHESTARLLIGAVHAWTGEIPRHVYRHLEDTLELDINVAASTRALTLEEMAELLSAVTG